MLSDPSGSWPTLAASSDRKTGSRNPLLEEDDHFLARIQFASINPSTGLLDSAPPYRLYPANFNRVTPSGNPLAGLQG